MHACHRHPKKRNGEMAERLKALDSKSSGREERPVGSNPTLSASFLRPTFSPLATLPPASAFSP